MSRIKQVITSEDGEIRLVPELDTIQKFIEGELDLPIVPYPEGFEEEV